MNNEMVKRLLGEVSQETKDFMEKNYAITKRIKGLMASNSMSQVELAEKLGKRPSEISKILSPGHNHTMKTIIKLEAVFGENIINVPKKRFLTYAKIEQHNTPVSFSMYRVEEQEEDESIISSLNSRNRIVLREVNQRLRAV